VKRSTIYKHVGNAPAYVLVLLVVCVAVSNFTPEGAWAVVAFALFMTTLKKWISYWLDKEIEAKSQESK
jgi:hypothetical protein